MASHRLGKQRQTTILPTLAIWLFDHFHSGKSKSFYSIRKSRCNRKQAVRTGSSSWG